MHTNFLSLQMEDYGPKYFINLRITLQGKLKTFSKAVHFCVVLYYANWCMHVGSRSEEGGSMGGGTKLTQKDKY